MSTDGRRVRGDRSRAAVLGAAVDEASASGLDGLSFGRLAELTGMSKAGVQTLFRTKEGLQLATITHAGEMFAEAVIAPTAGQAPGAARLRMLVECWIGYVRAPLFRGGCFWIATLTEQDSRPGPLRDALVRQKRYWQRRLTDELGAAVDAGEVVGVDPAQGAFEINAALSALNSDLLVGETSAIDHARQAVERVLAGPRAAV